VLGTESTQRYLGRNHGLDGLGLDARSQLGQAGRVGDGSRRDADAANTVRAPLERQRARDAIDRCLGCGSMNLRHECSVSRRRIARRLQRRIESLT